VIKNYWKALALLLIAVGPAKAEDGKSGALYDTIAAEDKALFEAYNTCDLKTFDSLVDPNVEFYHDRDGFSAGKAGLVQAVHDNICGKVTRELVPGTLEVYPIKGYGAVEIGVHRFHHPGHDDTEPVGEAKFVHLWQLKDGAWHLTRVISFAHRALPKHH